MTSSSFEVDAKTTQSLNTMMYSHLVKWLGLMEEPADGATVSTFRVYNPSVLVFLLVFMGAIGLILYFQTENLLYGVLYEVCAALYVGCIYVFAVRQRIRVIENKDGTVDLKMDALLSTVLSITDYKSGRGGWYVHKLNCFDRNCARVSDESSVLSCTIKYRNYENPPRMGVFAWTCKRGYLEQDLYMSVKELSEMKQLFSRLNLRFLYEEELESLFEEKEQLTTPDP